MLANPITTVSSIPKVKLDAVINEAVLDAERDGHTGKHNTPYVLNRIKELSKGETVVANRALVKENVRKGAIVAKELAILRKNTGHTASE